METGANERDIELEQEAEKHKAFLMDEQKRSAFGKIPPMYRDIEALPPKGLMTGVQEHIIFGAFGTGKTYAAYQMAMSLFNSGDISTFLVVRAFRMLMDIKSSFSAGSYENVFKSFLSYDLLVIDEWGKNSGSDFEESVLFEIINSRYENRKRTTIIVNADKREDLRNAIRPDLLDRFRRGIYEISGKSRR